MSTNWLDTLQLSAQHLVELQATVNGLHGWYHATARTLPWRSTRDPYAIWVSEVMLQQTRVATVVPYYEKWLAAFPTISALARADETAVLALWEGLGYYSRGLNLHRAARKVVAELGGEIPRDPDRFRSLPGVGPYTTAAVLSIAFDLDLAVLDGNVFRILSRLTALPGDPRRAPWRTALEKLANALLPPGRASAHNQAMMELGAKLCTPRSPRCPECILATGCRAWAAGEQESYPLRPPRSPTPHYDVAIALVQDGDRVFIDRRPYGGLLGGLWEFPGGKIEEGESAEAALHRELAEEFGLRVRVVSALARVDHAYSHFRVTLHPWVCRFEGMDERAGEGNPWKWVTDGELDDHPMPRANRRVLRQLRAWREVRTT